jgi:8-oxo-dGTP pyrophosphatase MutT (NUDIX family)
MSKANEEVVFEGNIFQLVHIHQPNGEVWEIARRAPGVRLIVINSDGTFKLSNEHRHELGKADIRLPGGKVFDKLSEYSSFLNSGDDIENAAKEAALKEAKEELGLENVKNIKLIEKCTLGATVSWDLYVFELSEFELGEQQTHGLEQIEPIDLTKDQILEAIENGDFNEDRIVPVLLRYLKNN